MATGDKTFHGLAVPLFGESEINQITAATDILTIKGATSQTGDFFVLRDVDNTEVMFITSSGYMRLNGTITDSTTLGFLLLTAASSTVGTNVNLQSQITVTKTEGATQDYAGWFYLDSQNSTTPALGGREAVLNLYYATGTTSAHAGSGFVFFDDGGTNAQIAFNFGANTCTNGVIYKSIADSQATAGIRCMFGTTVFYILCSSCPPAG